MDPNTIIEALRGTMDPALREAAERQLNEVRTPGRRRRAGGRTVAGRALWARLEMRTATLRAPAGEVGRGPDRECHARAPLAATLVVTAAQTAFASDPELGLWLRSRHEEPAEAGVTGWTHGWVGWPAVLWIGARSLLAPRRGRNSMGGFSDISGGSLAVAGFGGALGKRGCTFGSCACQLVTSLG